MTAPAELVIDVTAEDIASGERRSLCLCPIALAVARLRGVAPVNGDYEANVIVNSGTASIPDGDGDWVIYLFPDEAGQFVIDFDNGHPVAPFTFTARLAGTTS